MDGCRYLLTCNGCNGIALKSNDKSNELPLL